MPGAVPITSTHALTNATLPYAIALADEGVAGAIRRDPGLRPGVNVAAGEVTHPARRRRRRHELHPASRAGVSNSRSDGGNDGRRDSCRTSSAARRSTRPRAGPRRWSTRPPARRSPRRRSRPRPTSTPPWPRPRAPFAAWAATPPGERARALLRMADLIEERGEEIADLESADAGKPRSAVVEDEIPVMADKLRFFAGAARDDGGSRRAASTWRRTPPSSAASRSASSARSRPGTTR